MEYGLELYHHGVKGQHWGKRNGPPYPLYRKSAYYKKTGQRPPGYTGNKKGKSDSGGTNKSGRVGGLKDIKRAGNTSWVRKRTLRKLTGGRIGGIDDSKSEKRKQLAKRIAIGAGTAAALAGAGYLAYRNRGRIAKDFRTIGTNAKTDYYKARGKIFNSKAYEFVERRLNDPRIRLAKRKAGYMAKDVGNKVKFEIGKKVNPIKTSAKELVKNPRAELQYRLGNIPGTAKLNSARVAAKNRITNAINRAKSAPGKIKNELTNPYSALRNDVRLVGTSAKGMVKNARKGIGNTYNSAKAGISKNANKAYNTYLREAGKARRSASNAKDYIKRKFYNNSLHNKATSMRNNIAISADEARRGIKSSIDKNKNKLYNTYLREAGKVRRNASNAKDYIKRTYNNKIRTAPGKAKELLSKPGSKVYERIAGESKRAAQAANYDMALNAKRKASLEKFIKSNAQAVENATISKRKVLANIRRGDYVKTGDTLSNLNAKANSIAAKERELISKGNEAKKLLASVGSQTKEGAARYNAAMAEFTKRNKLGRIAAGATNAGIGLGLAGAAGGAGYGISKLARSGKQKNQNRGTIGGLTKRMTASSTDSAVTRRAKAAYNSMSDAEFRRKYSVSKAEYARRVEKYGDPYKNSPMAKLGRRLSRRRRRR